MIHVSIEFEQECSPYSYSIHDMGSYIRIRFTEKIDDGTNISVIDLPPNIIREYVDGLDAVQFLSHKISADFCDGFLHLRADAEGDVEFARIPASLWETYVGLARKAEMPYGTED